MLHRTGRRGFAAVLILSLCLCTTAGAEEESTAATGLSGLAAGATSMVYTPLKIVYAGSGLVVSALAFVFSAGDFTAPSRVTRASVRGDWVVTPNHLVGDRDLQFVGN